MHGDDAHKCPTSHDRGAGRPDLRTKTSAFSPDRAWRRFQEELAYYRADEPYLPVEKCAERCATLSQLLTVAARRRIHAAPSRTTLVRA